MMERNVERMDAALSLLEYLMKQKQKQKKILQSIDCTDLNMVLVVAGYDPIDYEEKEVEVIDTVCAEG